MRVLSSLTYYDPHISGLTIYAKRVLQGLAQRGHTTTIVTSQHDKSLPKREMLDDVCVVRTRATVKVSKGIVMPFYPFRLAREIHRHDVLLLNLPQLEAWFAAVYARVISRKPVVTVYQCDIELPPGLTRMLFMPLIQLSHLITGIFSNVIVVTSQDYANNSRYARRFARKVVVSPPPCSMREPAGEIPPITGSPIIGFVGRFAEEKGIAYLIDAMPEILRQAPDAHVVFVGEWQHVIGERVYDKMKTKLDALGEHVTLTGLVSDQALAAYFAAFDVLVLPSVNSTEAFGMVQVEAMLAGTPVVATDRPGIREPIVATGMGELVPPRDSAAIARAVLQVTQHHDSYIRPRADIERVFGVERAVTFFEELFTAVRTGVELPTTEALRLTGTGS
jgi:glycosyltransferase involved in cell wall biosynthesis